MEILNFSSQIGKVYRSSVSCEFCPRVFDTVSDKNAHIMIHFEQQICHKCDQNLLRIGEHLYVLHGTITCIDTKIKQETFTDEQHESEILSRLHDPVDANFLTDPENANLNDGHFEEKQEITEFMDPIENNSELRSTCVSPPNVASSECSIDERNTQNDAQDAFLDESNIKLELNEENELAESEVVTFDTLATKVQQSKFDRSIKRYKCEFEGCNEILSLNTRKLHIARKHTENNLECDVCKKTFPTISQIRQHMISHEDSGERFGCEKCGSKNITKRSLERHHEHPNFVCSECGIAFCKISQLKVHYKSHDGANPNEGIDISSKLTIGDAMARKCEKKYKCTYEGCDDLVSTATRRYHMATKHKTIRYDCDLCKKTFPTLFQIRVHMNVHGAKCKRCTCNVCGVSNITKGTLQRHHYKQNFECSQCGMRFCLKTQLKVHNILKHKTDEALIKKRNRNKVKNIKKYKCTFEGCNDLVSSNSRSYHMARKHKTTQFECDVCKKVFATKAMVQVHILRLHVPSAKKFKCKLCGSAYLSKSLLKWHHKLSHIKEHNFMCSECGETFLRKNQLAIHITKHTGEKPFKCTFEGCSKGFRTQTGRAEHLRSHTGEKPYQCSIDDCDRRFAYAIDFKRHKYNAHGIYTKKFPCPICAEIFPENMLLKKHMKKHEVQM